MTRLLFASANENKAREIRAMLDPAAFELITLNDIGFTELIEETGATFRENASLKSGLLAGRYMMNVFADDSGLEVDALGGRPGVRSARYAGEPSNEKRNMELLLQELGSGKNRKARFITMISLRFYGEEYFFEGVLEGVINTRPKGTQGFGYDPVFVPEGETKTLAEISMFEKNQISHRSRALRQLLSFLEHRKED